ncbi:MAG: hypothetical protein R6V30_01280 [Paracoccaceae bacterium]|nr:hypothetical protein [Loktanella sp.]
MSDRIGLLILAMGGIVVIVFATLGYITPMSGITGTPGPLVAAAGGAALIIGAGVLAMIAPSGWRSFLHFLVILALVGCALCGWFLLTPGIVVGAVVGAVGFFLYLAAVGGRHERKTT